MKYPSWLSELLKPVNSAIHWTKKRFIVHIKRGCHQHATLHDISRPHKWHIYVYVTGSRTIAAAKHSGVHCTLFISLTRLSWTFWVEYFIYSITSTRYYKSWIQVTSDDVLLQVINSPWIGRNVKISGPDHSTYIRPTTGIFRVWMIREKCRQHNDQAMVWTVRGTDPGRDSSFSKTYRPVLGGTESAFHGQWFFPCG